MLVAKLRISSNARLEFPSFMRDFQPSVDSTSAKFLEMKSMEAFFRPSVSVKNPLKKNPAALSTVNVFVMMPSHSDTRSGMAYKCAAEN